MANNPGLIARLLQYRLQLVGKSKILSLIESFEPELRAFGQTGEGSFPDAYGRRLDPLFCVLARQLHYSNPEVFWGLHKRWAFSKIRRLKQRLPRTHERDGLKYQIDIGWRTPFEHYFGYFEYGLVARIASLLEPDDQVFDVGANMGLFALPLAQRLKKGKLWAFEPNPAMLDILNNHIAVNGMAERIQVMPYAVAEENASMELSIPDHNPGGGSLLAGGVWDRPRDQMVQVQVRAFAELFEEMGKPSIKLVKIDVEGYEPQVISAMGDFLGEQKPILVLEISPKAFDPAALFEQLRGFGYAHIVQITNDGELRELHGVPTDQINVICSAQPL